MKKIAIFTEGKTERILVTRLIEHIAQTKNYSLKAVRIWGGVRFQTYDLPVENIEADGEPDLSFQILDCSSQDRVVSEISERYQKLVDEGYSVIVGMRDLYPDFARDEHDKLMAGSLGSMPTSPVAPQLIFCVMEIEAWFIAEKSHFPRRHHSLTDTHIAASLGVDLQDSAENIPHPAKLLAEIYELADLSYGKSEKDVTDTVSALDLQVFANGANGRAHNSKKLYDLIDELFRQNLE